MDATSPIILQETRGKEHIMHYTGTIWRPPYEADSLILEATAGCTHHRCKFCTLYDELPFKFKVSELSAMESDLSRSSFADSSIHTILFCSLLLRLLSFDFSLCTFFAHIGQYFEIAEPGTYSTPHTVQCLAGNAVHRFVGVICNSPTKPMNL